MPGAGFKLDYHFAPSDNILQSLSPVLDSLVADDVPKFTVQQQGSFNVEFLTDAGFHYTVDPSRVAITFKHRVKAKPVSGGPPIMEMLSRPLPYTELLPQISSKLIEATLLLTGPQSRTVKRVGIISTTAVAEDELPPGIARFISYVGRPWRGLLSNFNISIAGEVDKASGWVDRCIHTLTKPEGSDQLMEMQFDWQRTFSSSRAINRESLRDILGKAERDSLKYFEEVAEGSLFDEEIIREVSRPA